MNSPGGESHRVFLEVVMDALIDGTMWILIGVQVVLTGWYGVEMLVMWWTGGRGIQRVRRDWWDW